MRTYPMLIDGQLVNSTEQDQVINPAHGVAFATCARASKAHVDQAVAAAARAYRPWRADEALRRQKLNECAAALQAHAGEVAEVLTHEQGKPLNAAMMELYAASMWFSYFANLETRPEVLQNDPAIVLDDVDPNAVLDGLFWGAFTNSGQVCTAIKRIYRTHYGLGGSIWTSDLARGEQLVQRIESGTGWVNQHMDITPFAPFGGCKWSGLGYENGKWGYEEFTEMQVVNAKK